MARIFIDGFESGNFNTWDYVNSVHIRTASTYGMDGSYCVEIDSIDECCVKYLPDSSEYYVGFWYRLTQDDGTNICEFMNGTTSLLSLGRVGERDNALQIRRGWYDGSILRTGTVIIKKNETHHIGIYVKIDDTVGRFKVVVDGNTDIDFTGDTQIGVDTTIDRFVLGNTTYASCDMFFCADNVVIDDSEMPEQTSIQAIFPTGVGTTTEWTPSTGANWSCVDEKPAVDTDYISVNALNKIDTYATGNLGGAIISVKAVQLQAWIAYEGAPTPTHVQLGVRSGGGDHFSDNKVPAVSFTGNHSRILNTDPADSAAWTESKVNALEIGVKATA